MDRLCDELGLDTIETGAAIAVLMDAGGMEWGDAEAAKKLLSEGITGGNQDALDVANGALVVGTARNHKRIPVAKGQAMPAWDPRPLLASGITYCSSAMGADHTAGLVIDPEISGEAAAIASQEIQVINALCDTSGFCMFLGPTIDEHRNFYSIMFSEEITNEQLADIGWQCLVDEWEFNEKAGFTAADDDMAACMREEPIGENKDRVFNISAEHIAMAKVRQPPSEKFYHSSPAG